MKRFILRGIATIAAVVMVLIWSPRAEAEVTLTNGRGFQVNILTNISGYSYYRGWGSGALAGYAGYYYYSPPHTYSTSYFDIVEGNGQAFHSSVDYMGGAIYSTTGTYLPFGLTTASSLYLIPRFIMPF